MTVGHTTLLAYGVQVGHNYTCIIVSVYICEGSEGIILPLEVTRCLYCLSLVMCANVGIRSSRVLQSSNGLAPIR